MGAADPLHRVHGRRLATVSGPGREPHRRGSEGRGAWEQEREGSESPVLRKVLGKERFIPGFRKWGQCKIQMHYSGSPHLWLGFGG